MGKRRRLGRFVHSALGAGVASVVFLTAFTGAVIYHGDLPASKRAAGTIATGVLGVLFKGKIVVDDVNHIGFDGVDVSSGKIIDPWGQTVAQARGIHVRTSIPGLLWSVMPWSQPIDLSIDHVHIDDGDVSLDNGPDGELRLASAFKPKTTPPPTPPGPVTPPTPLHVALPNIEIGHGWAHGTLGGLMIDADAFRIPGSLLVTHEGVAVDINTFSITAREPAPMRPTGTADYHLRISYDAPPKMWAGFQGRLGEMYTAVSAKLEGTKIDAAIDVPKVSPDELRTLIPSAPIHESVTAKLIVQGTLPSLELTGRIIAGPSELDLQATTMLDAPLKLDAEVKVRDLDPRIFDPSLPPASLGGDAQVKAVLDPSAPQAEIEAMTFPFTLSGQAVPGATLKAKYVEGKVEGNAEVFEPGVDTSATFSIDPKAALVDFDASIKAQSLGRAPRLRGQLEGRVQAKVKGKFHKDSGLDATIDADLDSVGKGSNVLGAGKLRARLIGQPTQLGVEAAVTAQRLLVGGVDIKGARVAIAGPLLSPRVRLSLDDPRWSALELSAATRLNAPGGPSFSQIKGKLALGDLETNMDVGAVSMVDGGVRVRGVEIVNHAGTIKGDLTLDRGGLQAQLEGKVDLLRAGRAFPELRTTAGKLDFVVDLKSNGAKRQGTASLAVRDAEVAGMPVQLSTDGQLTFEGERIGAQLVASARGAGGVNGGMLELVNVDVTADGLLPGELLAQKSWSQLTGEARINGIDLHLSNVFSLPLVKTLLNMKPEVPRLTGDVRIRGGIKRESLATLPSSGLRIETTGLSVIVPGEKGIRGGVPELSVTDMDLIVRAGLRPVEQRTTKENIAPGATMEALFGAQILDTARSPLVQLQGSSTVHHKQFLDDLLTLFRSGLRADKSKPVLSRLGDLPLNLSLGFQDQKLETLPATIRPKEVRGTVSAHLDVSGTFAHPVARVAAQTRGLVAEARGFEPWPVFGSFTGTFDDERCAFAGSFVHEGGVETAEVGLTAHVGLGDVVWQREALAKWALDAQAQFSSFRLEAIPPIASFGAGGVISGTVDVTGLHKTPYAKVDLRIDTARFFDADLATLQLRGWVSEGAGVLTLLLEQPPTPGAADGGRLLLTALPSVHFVHGYEPDLDPIKEHSFSAKLERFDIEPFSPLAAPLLADLRGYLDGEATLAIRKRNPGDVAPTAALWGGLLWREGVLLIPQIGQTFTHGTMWVTTTAQDNTSFVAAHDITLDATNGRVHGSAQLALPNEYIMFSILRPGRDATEQERQEYAASLEAARNRFIAHAQLSIDSKEKIPVTFEGVSLGDAYGVAEASMRLVPEGTDITVGVPELTFELPETNTYSQSVQDLSDNPDVALVDRTYKQGGASQVNNGPKRRIRTSVALGAALSDIILGDPRPKTSVLLRRAGLEARLTGMPVIDLDDNGVHVSGSIETISGRVLALGKPFEVQPGFVRFDGPINNPYLNLSASWDSSDGARIYAEMLGYLKDMKLRLRSDPPRSENDILALLLFGRDNSQQMAGQADPNVAIGSGVASTLLSTLLDPVQIFGAKIETRVETTATRGTSIGVAAEIRPKLWATVDVSTARQHERANADLSAVTLDWRFKPKWSLRTTVGDRGSSTVELLWQYRY